VNIAVSTTYGSAPLARCCIVSSSNGGSGGGGHSSGGQHVGVVPTRHAIDAA
jgi:hypothetical protein